MGGASRRPSLPQSILSFLGIPIMNMCNAKKGRNASPLFYCAVIGKTATDFAFGALAWRNWVSFTA